MQGFEQMGIIWDVIRLLIASVLGGAAVWLAGSFGVIRLPNAASNMPLASLDISYSDFVTVMLTGATVVLAAVGIGVGVVAAYTIRNLQEDAEKKVDEAVAARLVGIEDKVAQIAYRVGRNLNSADDLEEDMEDR
jgi:hypothetical protein